jgi:hypothetical protein
MRIVTLSTVCAAMLTLRVSLAFPTAGFCGGE